MQDAHQVQLLLFANADGSLYTVAALDGQVRQRQLHRTGRMGPMPCFPRAAILTKWYCSTPVPLLRRGSIWLSAY
jgi:hypothetical protein